MKFKISITTIFLSVSTIAFGQTIKRIDGSKITADSLNAKIEYLMNIANVSGIAISVFNDHQPVFNKTYGLADVQKKYSASKNIGNVWGIFIKNGVCLHCYAIHSRKSY